MPPLSPTPYSKSQTDAMFNQLDATKQGIAEKDQPGGYLGINNEGEAVTNVIVRNGDVAAIDADVYRTGELVVAFGEDGSCELRIGDGETLGGLPYLGLTTSSCIVARPVGTPEENGEALQAAIAAANAMLPNGNARSNTNRATVLVLPGHYKKLITSGPETGFILPAQYTNIIGIGSPLLDLELNQTSAISYLILHDVSDVTIKGFRLIGACTAGNNIAYIRNFNPSTGVLYEDLDFLTGTGTILYTYGTQGWSGTYRRIRCPQGNLFGIVGSGYFEDCVGGQDSFDGNGGGAGTFVRCRRVSANAPSGSSAGTFIDCHFEVTGSDQHAFNAANGAKLRNCVLLATGTGRSVNGIGVTIEVANCTMNRGLAPFIINTYKQASNADATITPYIDFTMNVLHSSVAHSTGDGKAAFLVPETLNGYNVVAFRVQSYTAGTTGTTEIQIARVRSGSAVDMCSTKPSIASGATLATSTVINASNDDLATGDWLRIDIDQVAGTPGTGLSIVARCEKPNPF